MSEKNRAAALTTAPKNTEQSESYQGKPRKTRAEKIQQRLLSVKPCYHNLYLKATRGEASPRQAIKAMCIECVGGIRREVVLCTDSACELFMYRPFVSDNHPPK